MKTPKVLLINPPQTYYKGSDDYSSYFLLGLLSIIAYVKTICDIKLFDCVIEGLPEHAEQNDVTQYTCDLALLKKKLASFNPDIIGITCPFSCQLENAVFISRLSKEICPNALVVMGGPCPTVQGRQILDDNNTVDMCVKGEGEIVFYNIIHQFAKNKIEDLESIKGIVFRKDHAVCENKTETIANLDSLPFPDYSAIDFEKYIKHPFLYLNRTSIHERNIPVITSRGCPFDCVFCSVHLHMGKKFRGHSVEYIIKHIEHLIQNYKITNIHFEDDNISFDKDRFEKILDAIIERKFNIKWDTPNGVRADTLDYPLLEKMKKSGCTDLNIAVESGNQKVLDNIIKKKLDLNVISKVAKWCKELNIPLGGLYVIGFPGETINDMKQTIDFSLDLYRQFSVYPGMMIATPLIGTKLYEECKEKKYLKYPLTPINLSKATQLDGRHMIETDDFNEDVIDDLIRYYEREKKKVFAGSIADLR